jgi:hypothetical protein
MVVPLVDADETVGILSEVEPQQDSSSRFWVVTSRTGSRRALGRAARLRRVS